MYTESLFLALLCATIWLLYEKKYPLALMTGILLGLTRVAGIFVPFIVLGILLQQHQAHLKLNQLPEAIKKILQSPLQLLVLLGPLIGFGLYSVYLFSTTGDFLAFFHLQPLSNAGRSTDLVLFPQVMYRYIKIFVTAQPNFQYFIAVVEFITFSGVLALLSFDLWNIMKKKTHLHWTRLGFNLFSFANLILPTLTGTFTSLPRYALLSISIYLVLAELKQRWLKITLALLFAAVHIILFMYFIQGYFVS